VSELFANYFETVVGLTTEELKTKSIYSTTNKQRIRVSPQEIYVGDSGIDMQTANAGMCCGSFLGLQTKRRIAC
jgi:phosphoglycolate phosphatase-like HAD superfamily hydrolase